MLEKIEGNNFCYLNITEQNLQEYSIGIFNYFYSSIKSVFIDNIDMNDYLNYTKYELRVFNDYENINNEQYINNIDPTILYPKNIGCLDQLEGYFVILENRPANGENRIVFKINKEKTYLEDKKINAYKAIIEYNDKYYQECFIVKLNVN